MTYDEAIEKVQKLLAIADCASANTHEAETAARQAAALMEKFNIETAVLQLAELSSDEPDLVQNDYKPSYSKGAERQKSVPPWLSNLAIGVAELTQTKPGLVTTRDGRTLRFSGYSTDVAFAQWMLDVVAKGVFNEAAKQNLTRGERETFRRAAAIEIRERLFKMRKEMVDHMRDSINANAGTALMVIDLKKQRITEAFGETKTKEKVFTSRNYAAYRMGLQYGREANLPNHQPLNGVAETDSV